MKEMTREEKVNKYFEEIKEVFGTKENCINVLNRYDEFKGNGDLESCNALDNITLGIHQKEYWVKFKIEEPNLLNSFLMMWVIGGKSIAGVQGQVLDFGGVCDKRELKEKLIKMVNEL